MNFLLWDKYVETSDSNALISSKLSGYSELFSSAYYRLMNEGRKHFIPLHVLSTHGLS